MKGKNKTILIVEDEPALLMVLADKFRREGFVVLEAKDGEEALRTALHNHPDLLILDIVMPSMDGLTMLKKLREDKWGEYVPVLILSNLSDPEQIDEAAHSGAIDFLVKSNWGLDDVITKVKSTFAKSLP